MRYVFDGWRSDAHCEYKNKQIDLQPDYLEQRRKEVLTEWDDKIAQLKEYLSHVQSQVLVEVNQKEGLVSAYETAQYASQHHVLTETGRP